MKDQIVLATNEKQIVTIALDGTVTLGEGVPVDDAARAFWDAVEASGAQRISLLTREIRARIKREECCGTCKHWGTTDERESNVQLARTCGAIPAVDHYDATDFGFLNKDPEAYAVFSEVGSGDFYTKAAFGCTKWEGE